MSHAFPFGVAGLLLPVFALGAEAERPAPSLPPHPLLKLPGLNGLLDEARTRQPELHRARAQVEAERAKLGPASALPDPDLAVGIQRAAPMDVTITAEPGMPPPMLMGVLPGRTEYSLMASQSLPWPGKREGRKRLAQSGVTRAEIEASGVELQAEGAVLESVLDLLVLRAQRELLQRQDGQWAAAEDLARSCCELGKGSAADLLQAMQERARLRQRGLALDAREADLLDGLARALGREPGSAPRVEGSLASLDIPAALSGEVLAEDLFRRSPLWRTAELDDAAAAHALNLAKLDRRPDLRLSLGLMKEAGMPAGWKAEVGFSLPVFAKRKQDQVLAQRRAEQAGQGSARMALRNLIVQRARERARAWDLALRTLRITDQELLPQGRAALESQMSRYESGKLEFPVVIESLRALLRDEEGRLEALQQVHRLALSQHRADLAPASGLQLQMAGGPMGGSSSPSATPSMPSATPAPSQAAGPSPTPMKM